MEIFEICGGNPLHGSVPVQGSKNSALPLLAASVLCRDGCELENCPDISDVGAAIRILRHLGCKAWAAGGTVTVDAESLKRTDIPDGLMREMRSSVIFLGAVLARCGEAEIYFPGGCRLGPRPIDMHLDAMERLGADVVTDGGRISCRAKRLRGAAVNFRSVSVGATENTMIAAATADGETVITNAAREPEIAELAAFLNAMGADIAGAGSSVIKIRGVSELHGARYRVMPDRIAGATILAAAAACGGSVELGRCLPGHMTAVLDALHDMGCRIEPGTDSVRLSCGGLHAARPVETDVYPGFPTDAQPLLMAASLKAEGTSVFVENIFESRFSHAAELRRMGGDIIISGRTAAVTGVRRLHGAQVEAGDLRGGAALMIAALSADGASRLGGVEYINRGYETPELTFAQLGADIERKEAGGAGERKK